MSFLYYYYYYQFWLEGSTNIRKAPVFPCGVPLKSSIRNVSWNPSGGRLVGATWVQAATRHSTVDGAKPNFKHVDRHHSPFDRNFYVH